jgi:hypothetical protein
MTNKKGNCNYNGKSNGKSKKQRQSESDGE